MVTGTITYLHKHINTKSANTSTLYSIDIGILPSILRFNKNPIRDGRRRFLKLLKNVTEGLHTPRLTLFFFSKKVLTHVCVLCVHTHNIIENSPYSGSENIIILISCFYLSSFHSPINSFFLSLTEVKNSIMALLQRIKKIVKKYAIPLAIGVVLGYGASRILGFTSCLHYRHTVRVMVYHRASQIRIQPRAFMIFRRMLPLMTKSHIHIYIYVVWRKLINTTYSIFVSCIANGCLR